VPRALLVDERKQLLTRRPPALASLTSEHRRVVFARRRAVRMQPRAKLM
jgi:hypothetical protein